MKLITFFALSLFSAAALAAGVDFVDLKDGAVVKSPLKVKFAVTGMALKPAGTLEKGTGHHHLIVNAEAVPEGKPVPTDANHLHFGKGQSETDLSLPPGKHTLTLQFADGSHLSYGPKWSKTIKVEVK